MNSDRGCAPRTGILVWGLWLIFCFWVAPVPALACGPYFPNSLLSEGDEALFAAPTASFIRELDRMNTKVPFTHVGAPAFATRAGMNAWTVELEKLALAARLENADTTADEREQVVKAYGNTRAKLTQFIVAWDGWVNAPGDRFEEGSDATERTNSEPEPPFPSIAVPTGIPQEYALYLEGAIAWHNPALKDKSAARRSWERVLELPPKERQDKSAWAAFMIGRSWERSDLAKCRAAFQQCRNLVQAGFHDPTGLAAASLGLEARECLRQQQFESAGELYLQQFASGDKVRAAASLHLLAASALAQDPAALAGMARNPRLLHIINAHLLSTSLRDLTYMDNDQETQPDRPGSVQDKWLLALETAGVRSVDAAEQLASIAYRNNDMERAEKWVRRAGATPVGQWVRAKLLLRKGRPDEAAQVLSHVIRHVQILAESPAERTPTLFESLTLNGGYRAAASSQVLGEAGVIYVARGDYFQALELLLQGGMWTDAAYVAERVLTPEELKSFVDEFYPAAQPATTEVPPAGSDSESVESSDTSESEQSESLHSINHEMTENIRYLLARRLTRLTRMSEARDYYPAEWLRTFDQLTDALGRGWDENAPAEQRADALFEAAVITRTNGLELMGTEVQPDWNLYGGNFEGSLTAEVRSTNKDLKIAKPLPEELVRSTRHGVEPPKRWHYRYQAAALAWEAARLMPDNSDDTAYVLWRAGTWLKSQDPPVADIFYKALVRRNRHTALGDAADRLRWFPRADESGLPILEPRHEEKEPEVVEEPQDGMSSETEGAAELPASN